ncbi:MAG: helix-turn-helix transcriptional regulator [Saprospiraceae bacterium]
MRTTLLGQNIKLLRKEQGVTQSALAEALGLKRNHIASYEAGIVEPRALTFLHLADYFDVLPEVLLTKTLRTGDSKRPAFRSQPLTAAMMHRLLGETVDPSRRMQQLIDTFRRFYELRIKHLDNTQPASVATIADFTNFFDLLDGLLLANRKEVSSGVSGWEEKREK